MQGDFLEYFLGGGGMYLMRREVRYVIKFEVKYCVSKLKEKFIKFASEKKSHRV